jgi:hypothetical protein
MFSLIVNGECKRLVIADRLYKYIRCHDIIHDLDHKTQRRSVDSFQLVMEVLSGLFGC